jgi:multidrug efflux pump subunit AcrA (membrane-fusion protein)
VRGEDILLEPVFEERESDAPKSSRRWPRLLADGGGGGCQGKSTSVAPSEPPVIPVSRPVEREVTDYVDFIGRTGAVQSVDVRPRVTRYLVKIPFKEGVMVKGGPPVRG